MEQFEQLSLNSVQINKVNAAEQDSRQQIFANVKKWKFSQKRVYNVRCKVDSGAEGNILP